MTAALLISGCLNQTNESADTSTETEEYVLSTPDTYKNLESFIYAYQTSDSPNIRSELPTERIYWINDNNPWKQRCTRGYKRYKETSGLIEWKECQIFHSIFT